MSSIMLDPPTRRSINSTPIWLGVMVVLWGLSWPATQLALIDISPLWLASFRFGSAALCLFGFIAVNDGIRLPRRADLPIVFSVGIFQMMAFTGLGMIAMTLTNTSHSVLLAYTTPLWAGLLSWLIQGLRPARVQLAAILTGVLGVALICSPLELDWSSASTFKGAALLLIGAICWALVMLHVRAHKWVSSPLMLAPWQMLLAAIPLGGIAWITEGAPSAIHWDGALIGQLIYIGPIATSVCFVISTEHGRRITPFAMSNFTLGVPLIGIAASVVILGNPLSVIFMMGLMMVLGGIALAALTSRR